MKHFFLYIIGVVVCTAATAQAQRAGDSPWRKLQIAEFAITNLYVDTVDERRLVEEAIIDMLAQLDPHSTYSNAEEVRKMNEPLQGNFEGIGVQFQMMDDTLLVIQPVRGGPSEKVGILAGDRIIAVGDTAIAGVRMPVDDITGRLRGPKGTDVQLTIVRRGVDGTLPFTVKRDKIPIYSLDASYLIRPGIGYIRINRFGATTPKEFLTALQALQKEGMRDLILDLQGNGGGYLEAAIDLANEFLGSKELIVYTQGRKEPRKEFYSKGSGRLRHGRLVVLVDEFSASASEIVTGAIQDWDRGVVVGRRTFGKGLVQRPIPLPDHSMIRLTVARYYTPAGRCIQKPYTHRRGGDDKAYDRELIERFNRGEMMHADSIHFPDSLKYATLKLHRTVYGGGGIMPDVFVPIDTTQSTPYLRQLAARGLILQTATKYIEQHRQALKAQYTRFEAFEQQFEVDEPLLSALREAADRAKITFEATQYHTSLPWIKRQLKALIARDLWDLNEFFRIVNTDDECVQKALELLTGDSYSQMLSEKK
ncbi:MAG: S41 family peptidase [Prevotellaceae bacterium]|jgi:carboxyl-terminal processing protease|nr:S41 family peptidase [Prevotellaceae bacterium]